MSSNLGRWSLVVALVLVGGALLLVAWRAPGRRLLILALAGGSLGFTAVVYVLEWKGLVGLPAGVIIPAGRYMVVPTLLLVSAYAVGLDWLASRLGSRAAWVPVAALVAASIVVCAIDFRVMDVRSGAEPWDTAVDDAAESCETDSAGAPADENSLGEVEIAPEGYFPAAIPCEILEPAAVRN